MSLRGNVWVNQRGAQTCRPNLCLYSGHQKYSWIQSPWAIWFQFSIKKIKVVCFLTDIHSPNIIAIGIGIPSWIPSLGWNSKLNTDSNWNSKLNSWSIGRVYGTCRLGEFDLNRPFEYLKKLYCFRWLNSANFPTEMDGYDPNPDKKSTVTQGLTLIVYVWNHFTWSWMEILHDN